MAVVRCLNTLRLVLVFFLVSNSAFAQCIVHDDTGKQLRLAIPAKRIISLAPDITENFYAIGAGPSIVGVIAGSNYPAVAKKKTIVGSFSGLDLERIISLKPDLIVTWGSSFARQIQILRNLHISVYVVMPVKLEDIPRTLLHLGCLTDHEKQAKIAATNFTKQLKQLKQQYQHAKHVKVFFQVGPYALLTLNKESWVNQAINICGGQNIFADAPIIAPEVSWEAVIHANPDVVINDSQQADWRQRWEKWPMINAVRNKRLYSIDSDLIDRAGPRLIEGVKRICNMIQNNPTEY